MNTVSHIVPDIENDFFFNMGACAPTIYRTGESLFKDERGVTGGMGRRCGGRAVELAVYGCIDTHDVQN